MIRVTLNWVVEDPEADKGHPLVIDTGYTKEEWDELDDDMQIDILEEYVRAAVVDGVNSKEISYPWCRDKVEDVE